MPVCSWWTTASVCALWPGLVRIAHLRRQIVVGIVRELLYPFSWIIFPLSFFYARLDPSISNQAGEHATTITEKRASLGNSDGDRAKRNGILFRDRKSFICNSKACTLAFYPAKRFSGLRIGSIPRIS